MAVMAPMVHRFWHVSSPWYVGAWRYTSAVVRYTEHVEPKDRTSIHVKADLGERLARLARHRSYHEDREVSITQVTRELLLSCLPEAERKVGLQPPDAT